MDVTTLVRDALGHLGFDVSIVGGADRHIVVDPQGVAAEIHLLRRSLVDDRIADRVLAEGVGSPVVVVADRVTEAARRHLVSHGAGYLDLRGHLGLRAKDLVISADVPPSTITSAPNDPLAGAVGLEVATRLLVSPGERVAVRALARELGRSASTVSSVLSALRVERHIDESNRLSGNTLFWRVAERWPRSRLYVSRPPDIQDAITARALRVGTESGATTGWALTDTAAAAVYGAPVAYRSGQQLDFLVPDASIVHRALRVLGRVDAGSSGAVSIRVAPVPRAVEQRVNEPGSLPWSLAHPVFVALDLAQDPGRGREILEGWHPDDRWPRVW